MPTDSKTPIKDSLPARQRRFVVELTKDPLKKNITKAAIAAGYSKKSAHVTASRMLKNAKIKLAVLEIEQSQEKRIEITTDKILQELALIAFSDPAHYIEIEPDGNMRVLPFGDMPPGASRAIKGVKTSHKIKEEAAAGERADKPSETVILHSSLEYSHHDKMKALELLGKNKKLFIDVKEVRGEVDLITPTGLQELGKVLRAVIS